jgi:hypothetical protein
VLDTQKLVTHSRGSRSELRSTVLLQAGYSRIGQWTEEPGVAGTDAVFH